MANQPQSKPPVKKTGDQNTSAKGPRPDRPSAPGQGNRPGARSGGGGGGAGGGPRPGGAGGGGARSGGGGGPHGRDNRGRPSGPGQRSGPPGQGGRPGANAPAAKPPEPVREAAPPAPPKPEVVSLIDDKPKPQRRRPAAEMENRPFSILPVISRFNQPEPPPPMHPIHLERVEGSDRSSTPTTGATGAAAAEEAVIEEVIPERDEKLIHLKPPIIVRDLAAAMGLKPFLIIQDLMEMNIYAAITQSVDPEVAAKVCIKHGFTFEKEKRHKGEGVHKPPPVVVQPPKEPEKPKIDELKPRPPIVTFMGHVDHGKTTLMDVIRKSRVAHGEAGGITQHIGAYSVKINEQMITFLDTPGHAAFTAMRSRGATVTDIVVLIVAADDGIMPQTMEALNHAKAAKVHIMVAITKIDLPGANIDRVKSQLQDKGLNPEDWGGDTIVCPVSAVKGLGVDKLLENILLLAEVSELKARDRGPARASVIEAQVEQGRGPTATVIIRNGTLRVGDSFICGNFDGKAKALVDDMGKPLKSAGPSTPCKVLGFSGLPNAGDELIVMESEKAAKALSLERLNDTRMQKLAAPTRPTLETLFADIADGHHPVLKVVLKTDVQGSAEAIATSLRQIQSRKVDLEIVHGAVGPISENDVLLATASNAIILGFNVKTENVAASAAKREGVQIKLFSIIYELIDQVKEAMAGLLSPENRESIVGHAEIRKVFDLSKGIVAGCYVTDGRIVRTGRARILRGKTPIYDGPLTTLRRFTEDVKEVRSGMECGIKLGDFTEYTEGDVIQCYNLEKIAQKL